MGAVTSLSFALLGSGEFEPWTDPIERWLLERTPNPDGRVLIFPAASAPEGDEVFDRWGGLGLEHYRSLGLAADVVELKTRTDAERGLFVEMLDGASMAFFSGGNPAYLVEILRGTPFWEALADAVRAGLPYAGCSAGMACLGELAPDSSAQDPAKLVWKPGLRFFPNLVLGPHWDALNRHVPSLRERMVELLPEGSRLLAVDENTAVVGDGAEWTIEGAGMASIHDAGEWTTWRSGSSLTLPLL
jgi:cyanophycinase-like exopeptidase